MSNRVVVMSTLQEKPRSHQAWNHAAWKAVLDFFYGIIGLEPECTRYTLAPSPTHVCSHWDSPQNQLPLISSSGWCAFRCQIHNAPVAMGIGTGNVQVWAVNLFKDSSFRLAAVSPSRQCGFGAVISINDDGEAITCCMRSFSRAPIALPWFPRFS